jgi:cytochrome c oxidase subunit 2
MNRRVVFVSVLPVVALAGALLAAVAWAGPAERYFEIRAARFAFTPPVITVSQGDQVRIRLISEDVHHGLYVDGYEVSTSARPGEDGSLTFVADKAGRFSFRCAVTCGEFHPYMIGYLVVEPNARLFIFIGLTVVVGMAGILLVFRRRKEPETE